MTRQPQLKPGPLDLEPSALTTWPPHLPQIYQTNQSFNKQFTSQLSYTKTVKGTVQSVSGVHVVINSRIQIPLQTS